MHMRMVNIKLAATPRLAIKHAMFNGPHGSVLRGIALERRARVPARARPRPGSDRVPTGFRARRC
eukprot:3215265-Prymnesium_polylepis.1